MPYVSFKLQRFEASLEAGEGPESGWRLRWRISLSDRFDKAGLSNGKDLRELPGNLFLSPVVENAEAGEAIGAMHFLEARTGSSDGVVRPTRDRYSVELTVSPATLRALFELEQQTKGPAEAIISVPDLHYGSLPDGSDKHWQLGEKRNWLAVDGLTFSFPDPEPDDEAEDDNEKNYEPNSTVQAIEALTHKVDDLAVKLEKAAWWLIAIVSAVLVTIVFR